MVFEPVEHVVGVVRGLVVTDEVPFAARIAAGRVVEELDEDLAAGLGGEESEHLAASHVERSHECQSPVADVLELAPDALSGRHRHVRITALKRLDAGLLVDADDVLVLGRLVVQAQDRVALDAKLVVLRVQPHLLSVRL